jgi:hypothetical protein
MKEGEEAPASYYVLSDDYILWPDVLLEFVESSTFRPSELHAIELIDGRIIVRYVRQVTSVCGELALEIHGDDDAERHLLPLRLVRRTGTARRFFYVKGKGAREKALATPANVVPIGAWLDSHPRPIRNLIFAEKRGDS